MSAKFSIDQDNCAYRMVDGEAILIHSETTFYYSLNDAGPKIWKVLLDGEVTVEEAARAAGAEGEPPAELLAATESFLGELTREQFLTSSEELGEGVAAPDAAVADGADWMPVLTKFDSLDELLVTGE